jgi:hypothetical protein
MEFSECLPKALAMAIDSRTKTNGMMIAEESSENASAKGKVSF